MEEYNSPKKLLDIKQIVQFGVRSPEDYLISFYKEVYNIDMKVKIRGLSAYEYDEINLEMYNEIGDPLTIKYAFDPNNEIFKPTKPEVVEEVKEVKKKESNEFPPGVKISEITKAFLLRNVLITFHAMRDYYKDLTVNDVKQLEGIDEIAYRINEKSGRTTEVMERIESFRREREKSEPPLPDEEGTQSL